MWFQRGAIRRFQVLASFLLAMFSLAGTATGGDVPAYRIGGLLATTGRLSAIGLDMQVGMRAAMYTINDGGGINGRQLEVVFDDFEGDPAKAVSLARKQVERDRVLAITGINCEACAYAMRDYMEQARVPWFGNNTRKDFTEGYKYTFTLVPEVSEDMGALAEQMLKRGWRRIAVLAEGTNPYGKLQSEVLKEEAERRGLSASVVEFATSDRNLVPAWLKIRGQSPDAVFITGSSFAPAANALKDRLAVGLKTLPVVMALAYEGTKLIELAGPAADGVFFVSAFRHGNLRPGTQKLFEAMRRYFPGEHVTSHHGTGFDGVMILAEAVRQVGPDREKIRDWVERLQAYEGTRGLYSFSPVRHRIVGDVRLVQWRLGEWTDVTQ